MREAVGAVVVKEEDKQVVICILCFISLLQFLSLVFAFLYVRASGAVRQSHLAQHSSYFLLPAALESHLRNRSIIPPSTQSEIVNYEINN